jgi:Zn finger protein HypA/HybF involved in hydrogenase expression
MVKLYCLKCKKKQEVAAKKMKMGKRFAYKAACPKCGTTMFQFTSAD